MQEASGTSESQPRTITTPQTGVSSLHFIRGRLSSLGKRRTGMALGLWGEAGIGKTHTALELLRGLSCRSLSLPAGTPLTDLAGRLPRPPRLPAWAARMMDRVIKGEPTGNIDLLNAVTTTLGGLAPFVLLLEDLHDAGTEQAELIGLLARAVQRTPGVGLLVTSRLQLPDGFESRRHAPLDPLDAARLLEEEAGAALPPEALGWIFIRASGNPLFSLEYFRLLARLGHLWNDARLWRWREPPATLMPVTVEALIERTLHDVLGQSDLSQGGPAADPLSDVAGAWAMLPGATDGLLAAVAGLAPEALDQARSELERRRVLFQREFVHPLYREMVLGKLDRERHRTLARRAVVALEHDPEAAADFVRDAELDPAEAMRLTERAAEAARAGGRTASEARLLARAADLAQGDHQARLALRAARALETISPPEALRLARLAAHLLPDDPETALYLAGRLVQHSRRLADADEVLARFPESVRLGPVWTAWQITWMMGSGQYAGALSLWDSHPELHGLPDPATFYSVAACLTQTGQFEQAAALARRGLELNEVMPAQRASLLNVSSIACAMMGQPEAAEAHLEAALTLAREHGLHQMLGALLQNRTKNLERTDQFVAALTAAKGAFQAYAKAGDTVRQANAGVLVAGHLTEFGQYQEAETLLLDSLALLERLGTSRFLVVAQTTLATLYRDWQPPHGAVLALRAARGALEQARQLGPVSSLTTFALATLARAEAAVGELEQATLHAQEAVDASGQAPDESTFIAHAAQAAVHAASARPEQAREALKRALTAAQAGGFILEVQRLSLEQAVLERDLGAARDLQAWFRTHDLRNGVLLAERRFPELASGPSAGLTSPQSTSSRLASPHASPSVLPHLEVLGVMRLGWAGETHPVRGRKRRELLAALLEAQLRGRSELSRLDLIGLLYPGSDELQASASLKELVHLTRTAFGAALIQTTPEGYGLGDLTSDAAQFLEHGDTRLWRGQYLQDTLPEGRDETVAEALHLALRTRTEAALNIDPPEAARVARLLLETEPYDAGVLALALEALRACGNHRSLRRLYLDACLRWSEVGEALPGHWTDFLKAQTTQGIQAL